MALSEIVIDSKEDDMARTNPKAAEAIEMGGEVPTSGGKDSIEATIPYVATVMVEGVCPLLLHRWNCEAVKIKDNGPKGSAVKKTDNVESYVYRTEGGELAIPGEYLRQAIIHAAKFRQDPRSPRKSAMDLFKAAIVPLTELASLGVRTWNYEDTRRVVIQRSGISRTRPAMKTGWRAEFRLLVNLPEYVEPATLNGVIQMAGRLIGVGDFRPTYGRFNVTRFSTEVG